MTSSMSIAPSASAIFGRSAAAAWLWREWVWRARWRSERLGSDERFAHLRTDPAHQFAIGGVAGLDRNQMCRAQRPAQQRQVADDIEHFVPHEFVRIAQRFVGQDGIVANDDGVFQAAAFDQAVLDQELDLLEKAKCAGVGDIAFPGLRRKLEAEKLGKSALLCPRWCR